MTEKQLKEKLFTTKKEKNPMANTIQNILEKSQKIAKVQNRDVTENDIVLAAKKENKELHEALEFPMEEKRKTELLLAVALTEEFLPAVVSKEQIEKFIQENKSNFTAIGPMMKALKERFGDSLDGKTASMLVKENL